jgi:hypothetical protein
MPSAPRDMNASIAANCLAGVSSPRVRARAGGLPCQRDAEQDSFEPDEDKLAGGVLKRRFESFASAFGDGSFATIGQSPGETSPGRRRVGGSIGGASVDFCGL